MKTQTTVTALLVALLAGMFSCATSEVVAPAPTSADDELAAHLASKDPEERQDAVADAGRHGPGAIVSVGPLLSDTDPAVVKNAELALWAVANANAAPGSPTLRKQAAAACLDLLEGRRELAREQRVTLVRILSALIDDEVGVRRLAGLIDDKEIGDMICWALERISEPSVDEILVRELERGRSPHLQRIVLACGARRTKPAVAALLALERQADAELGEAARHALARIGDPRAEGLLVAAARTGSFVDRDNLLTLADRLLEDEDSRGREIYAGLLHDPRPHLRAAAVQAMGRLGYDSLTSELIAALGDEAPAVRAAAADALRAMPGEGCDRELERAWQDGPGALRASVLELMAARDPKRTTSRVIEALGHADADVRLVALGLVARIDHPAVEPALVKAAREGGPEERAAALLGYLQHADMKRHQGDEAAALQMIDQAVQLSDDDKVLSAALREVEAIGKPTALPLLDRFDQHDSQRENVAQARFAIARGMAESQPDEAIPQLERVYAESHSRWRRQAAVAKLTELGVDTTSFSARSGFFSTFWLLGPLPEATEQDLGSHPFGDSPIDPSRDFDRPEGAGLTWTSFTSDDLDGQVDLRARFDKKEHACAYAYTTFEWPEDTPALLLLGSDDGVAVWLNGELVHENFVWRGMSLDQDRVAVDLRAGDNSLLIKVTQGGGDWGFCVRLADTDGHPLDLTAAIGSSR